VVHQILFVSDVPCQQICHEHIGEHTFPVNHFHHGFLIDLHHRAIGHCCCRAHAEGLPRKTTFSKEIALSQNPYCGFFLARGYNSEFYPPFRPRLAAVALASSLGLHLHQVGQRTFTSKLLSMPSTQRSRSRGGRCLVYRHKPRNCPLEERMGTEVG
jgi:hypothetical protein